MIDQAVFLEAVFPFAEASLSKDVDCFDLFLPENEAVSVTVQLEGWRAPFMEGLRLIFPSPLFPASARAELMADFYHDLSCLPLPVSLAQSKQNRLVVTIHARGDEDVTLPAVETLERVFAYVSRLP